MNLRAEQFDQFQDSESIWGKYIREAISKATREIGIVNVLIAGKTGVGKSTLINAIFHGKLAETGQGKPVTKETRKYTKKGIPLAIYDTRGLELEEDRKPLEELEKFVRQQKDSEDASQHIHIAWMCFTEKMSRVEDAEIKLHQMLAEHMPILGVITKVSNDQGFRAEVQRLLPRAANVVRVRALPERLDDGHVMLPKGLQELVEATMELIPEATQSAFAAAQKVSIDLKKNAAHKVVAAAATTAAGVGAIPIPASDAVALVPIQITMLAGISKVFGIGLSLEFLATLVAAMGGTVGVTFLGRAIVSSLLKLIPGVGSVTGGAIAATTAAALTTALGELYIAVLVKLTADSGGDAPSPDDIAREFKSELKNRLANR